MASTFYTICLDEVLEGLVMTRLNLGMIKLASFAEVTIFIVCICILNMVMNNDIDI